MNFKWYHILFLVLGVCLGFYIGKSNTRYKVKTVYQKTPVKTIIDSIVYKHDTLILPQKPIDTLSVVEDYYRNRSFDTTIVVNEVKLTLGGNVYQNKLQGLSLITTNLRPIEVYKELKWNFSAGVTIGNNVVAPMIYSQYANHEIGIGYNIVGEKGFMIGYKYTFLSL